MDMVGRALALFGDSDMMAAGELRAHLFPDWRARHGDDLHGRKMAGHELARSLGTSPRTVEIEPGKYRSMYLRADLETMHKFEPTPSVEVPHCPSCGATRINDDACWRCGVTFDDAVYG